MIFINFKTYSQGTGKNALELSSVIELIAQQNQIKLIPAVQALDLKEVATNSRLEVWAQHLDPIEFGSHTGHILPEALVEAGAGGTLLNHSENKFQNFSDLEFANKRALTLGLKTLIFAASLEELKRILPLSPTFVSYEPPEFIGSSDKSVASEEPEIIKKAYELTKEYSIPLIVGAGIHSKEDIKISLSLGATGFAVASDILKAQDPKKELLELCEGYN